MRVPATAFLSEKFLLRFTTCLTALLVLSGCGGIVVPSLRGFEPAPSERSTLVLEELRASTAAVRTGRGEYEAQVSGGIGRQTLRQVVAFSRPDHLRFELFASALEQLVLLAVVEDGTLQCLDPRAGILYRGASTPENIARVLGAPLIAEEAMLWLTGHLPIPSDAKLLVGSDPAHFVIKGSISPERCAVAHFDSSNGPAKMKSLELRRCESQKLFFFSELFYENGDTPSRLTFSFPDQRIDGTLTRQSFTLNPKLPADRIFKIQQPGGVRIEPIEKAPAFRR